MRLPRVHRPGRVVRVDDHQGPGVLGDLRGHIVQVGLPAGLLVAAVMRGPGPAQDHRARPQRVVGAGHEDLVAGIQESLEGHHDQLGHPVAQVDVVRADVGHAQGGVVLRHRQPGRVDAPRIAVTLSLADVLDELGHDAVGGHQAKRGRVADVELEDPVPFGFQLPGPAQHRAADVVPNVVQPAGLRHHHHVPPDPGGSCPPANSAAAVTQRDKSLSSRSGARPANRFQRGSPGLPSSLPGVPGPPCSLALS